MADAFWVLWFAGCLLIAYWLIRAARDYRDDEPAAPDDQPGTCDAWAAAWNRRYAQPAYDPNHSTKGD